MWLTRTLVAASLVFAVACTGDSFNTSRNGVAAECEIWEADDTARVLWPPNNKLRRFSLADCVDIIPVECPAVCGNGIVEGTEECDDGNTNDFDFCSNSCVADNDPGNDKPSAPASVASSVNLRITSITSDESGVSEDAFIVDDTTFDIRAQRDGSGDGRLYTVNFVDDEGLAGACYFSVPHDQASSY
jgi:cysteine-rich repeat protein